MSDIENPKLGFESPESGELFKNISFFEKKKSKKIEKKVQNFFLLKNRPKMRFNGF